MKSIRLISTIAAVLMLGVLASTAAASTALTLQTGREPEPLTGAGYGRALVTAVARWAAHQDGYVTSAHPWSINRRRELVTVAFPIDFEPSGLVGTDTMTILAWKASAWWVAEMRPLGVAPFMGVNMRALGARLTYPAGTEPAGPPTVG